jgi:hypothetical protein
MRRCLKGLGGFPTSTDGFILGPSHGLVGRLAFSFGAAVTLSARFARAAFYPDLRYLLNLYL